MSVAIIIPARYGSTRYRGKPLVKIFGREMVLRVADICSKVVGRNDLYIATDSKKISNVVKKNNYKSNSLHTRIDSTTTSIIIHVDTPTHTHFDSV